MTTGLQGNRVRLRALTSADNPTLREYINDPAILQFSNIYRPVSDVEQEAWFRGMTSNPSVVWFGIDDLAAQPSTLVGTCCLVDIDWISRAAELRLRIGAKQAWGRALGAEACSLLVHYGFVHMNLQRIWLRVFAPNERALRLYERLGFVKEGRLRRAWTFQGVTDDVIVMGLLREEFRPHRS